MHFIPGRQGWFSLLGRATVLQLVVSLLTACSGKPYVVELPEMPPQQEARRTTGVFIVNHGWHTNLAVPAAPLEQRLPALKKRFGTAAYYEVGWGDKEFYQAEDITTAMTLRAIFWPSAAALRVAVVPYSPKEFFYTSEVTEICLNERELNALLQFVQNSFYHGQDGNIVATQNGVYRQTQFYDAEGQYYLFNTSNKWAAKALCSAGLDIWPDLKLTSGSVLAYLRDSGRASATPCGAR